MSNPAWSFADFLRWLRTRSESLRGPDTVVELDVHETARASARLRVERGTRVGELTVWNDGAAHMAVLSLQSGDFIFERDGVSLAESSVEVELKEFFDQLTGVPGDRK